MQNLVYANPPDGADYSSSSYRTIPEEYEAEYLGTYSAMDPLSPEEGGWGAGRNTWSQFNGEETSESQWRTAIKDPLWEGGRLRNPELQAGRGFYTRNSGTYNQRY